MKRIINGKKYDTDTARVIYEYCNGLPCNDFGYCREYLFLKKTGEFFIYGEGGPMTKYATRYGNCYGDGEGITPLTLDKAKEWAERVGMDVDVYERVFGEVEE